MSGVEIGMVSHYEASQDERVNAQVTSKFSLLVEEDMTLLETRFEFLVVVESLRLIVRFAESVPDRITGPLMYGCSKSKSGSHRRRYGDVADVVCRLVVHKRSRQAATHHIPPLDFTPPLHSSLFTLLRCLTSPFPSLPTHRLPYIPSYNQNSRLKLSLASPNLLRTLTPQALCVWSHWYLYPFFLTKLLIPPHSKTRSSERPSNLLCSFSGLSLAWLLFEHDEAANITML